MNPWIPIEFAPKDGTYILAVPDGTFSPGKAYVPSTVAYDAELGKFVMTDYLEEDAVLPEYKYWQPLPPSPTGHVYATLNKF